MTLNLSDCGGGCGRWRRSQLFLSFLLLIGYLTSFNDIFFFMFVVFPGHLLPPYCWIWTCFTYSFIEVHLWIVGWNVLVVWLQGILLEPLLSSKELVAFYAVVTVFVGLMTALTYVALYLVTQDTYYLFDVYVNGMAGYVAAVSVAVKKAMPDRVILSLSSQKLLCGHIPLLLLVFTVFMRKIGIVSEPFPVMFFWGLIVSWIYLRVHKRFQNWICLRVYGKQITECQDDNNDSFSLASFLPQSIRSAATGNRLHSFLTKCRHQQYQEKNAFSLTDIPVSLNGFENNDTNLEIQTADRI